MFGSVSFSVTSRPDDNKAKGFSNSRGLVINPNKNLSGVQAQISQNTSGVGRARLYDYAAGSYIESVGVSGLSGGDTFSFSSSVTSGQDYGIELDNNGNSFTVGFNQSSNYPYTGSDLDIVARSGDGTQQTDAVQAVNDIRGT
ncbi:hypothetical protein 7865G3D7_31 [Haloquadratum phage sp.]|nr:hypothetical protein 7865G3D7_31 [Haloquadratum phage sp.]